MTAPKPDQTLDALRREIDTIDDQILGLLVRRFAATEKVKATKAHDGSIAASPFRPAREAAMMRRLIGAGGTSVSPELLVRLWRVILSASTQSQAPVLLHMDEELGQDLATRLQIAQHFCGMGVALHSGAAGALDALHKSRGDLAIVATASPWAEDFLQAGSTCAQVIGTLPVIAQGSDPSLLVLGHAEPQASGDDETLVLLPAPAAPPPPAALWRARSGTAALVSLPGFLTPADPLLQELLARHPGTRVAGRCPRPIKV